MSGSDRMDVWEARLLVTCVSVLPWPQKSPVSDHMAAEGIVL